MRYGRIRAAFPHARIEHDLANRWVSLTIPDRDMATCGDPQFDLSAAVSHVAAQVGVSLAEVSCLDDHAAYTRTYSLPNPLNVHVLP